MNYFLNKTKKLTKSRKTQQRKIVDLQDQSSDSDFQVGDYPAFTWDQYYSPFKLMLKMHTPIDITDTTLAWACTLPLTNSVARTLFYTVKKGTFVRRYEMHETVPLDIFICCDGVQGFIDKDGNTTTKVAKFGVQCINIQEQETVSGQINPFQLVTYKLEADCYIQIPLAVKVLKIRIMEDDGPLYVNLPASPFTLECSISRRLQPLKDS